MALEQRIAFLEGRVVEHAGRQDRTNASIVRLEERMDARFDQVERRFEQLEGRMSRQFMWLVGMHVATLVTVVGALVAG